ncbi:uncharacterized protein OCT59_012692 [Rhizophagus irregularis]|uniref:uncharacterized protein n=1 Tax=Rhizophagus irregularis TaxID=588596 RepID=UPI00331BF1D0|nr:hypothetical protein OCT59_012692 [Rhizophagus irregularis]
MTRQSITLNVNKPQKKIFLLFDIKFNKFTLEEVTIPPYILVKFFFLAHHDPTGFGKYTQIADHFVPLSGGPAINYTAPSENNGEY